MIPEPLASPMWCTVSHPARPPTALLLPWPWRWPGFCSVRTRWLLCPALLALSAYPRAAEGGCFPLSPTSQPRPEASVRRPQSGPSRPPHPCSALPPSPGGMGPSLPISSDGFTSASQPANIFSLSTPQFLKSKPHHMLWPRGLGEVAEVVPWADCFPTINSVLPPQSFLQSLSQELV